MPDETGQSSPPSTFRSPWTWPPRIAQGELAEGSRIYGRSVMASEYNVSPETIRRALRLLADMKVVEVKPQSGAVVLSADSARRYIENFAEDAGVHSLRLQLKDLLAESAEVNRRMAETVSALVKGQDTFAARGAAPPELRGNGPQGFPPDRQKHRRAEVLAVHRRHHRGHPPGPDGDPLPRPLRRTVRRRRDHPGGQLRRGRGRPPASNDKGVKAVI